MIDIILYVAWYLLGAGASWLILYPQLEETWGVGYEDGFRDGRKVFTNWEAGFNEGYNRALDGVAKVLEEQGITVIREKGEE